MFDPPDASSSDYLDFGADDGREGCEDPNEQIRRWLYASANGGTKPPSSWEGPARYPREGDGVEPGAEPDYVRVSRAALEQILEDLDRAKEAAKHERNRRLAAEDLGKDRERLGRRGREEAAELKAACEELQDRLAEEMGRRVRLERAVNRLDAMNHELCDRLKELNEDKRKMLLLCPGLQEHIRP